ncbi:MAG: twin-arginine translocase subunit TatB [Mangrovicoccus sp.]|nr:twin-arginine translocase subunit TatB [Mangrovicoccus sp.]
MLDVGWSELLVIGVVALIVVGPKDLPILFRRMGEVTGRMRSMAREFTHAMNQAADEAGVREMQRNLRDIANPRDMGLDAMRSTARDFASGMGDTPAAPATPAAAATGPAAPAASASEGTASPTAAPATVAASASPAEPTRPAASQDDPKA